MIFKLPQTMPVTRGSEVLQSARIAAKSCMRESIGSRRKIELDRLFVP